jgi:hypothetical protein
MLRAATAREMSDMAFGQPPELRPAALIAHNAVMDFPNR